MKQIGVWIDKREAKIILIENGDESITTIQSEIEEFIPKGRRFKGGAQEIAHDSTNLNREKIQRTKFFENIVEQIESADMIVIFGPAETGEKLYTELLHKHPQVHARTKPVETADNMTDNQLKAWVKSYLESSK